MSVETVSGQPLGRALGIALAAAAILALSCGTESDPGANLTRDASGSAVIDSRSFAAEARIGELRSRFRTLSSPQGAASRLGDETKGTTRVTTARRASADTAVVDRRTGLSIGFALEGTSDSVGERVDGIIIYRGALNGADVLDRVSGEGVEDFVVLENPPPEAQLRYTVDVSHASGLRLVSNTLEFLSDSGTPALRIAPPYVVDAGGTRHPAVLAVEGCAFDDNPAAPWGRQVTKPGAQRCSVTVSWSGEVVYPALVDPTWSSTGSMAFARGSHTATLLQTGHVLIAGGAGFSIETASAELYDPVSGTFAATGSLSIARSGHTATLLSSGKVLIAGGRNGKSAPYILASAELYDPSTNSGSFVPTGPMAVGRVGCTAVRLNSGNVLVTGGYDTANITSSAEIFDPAADSGAGGFVATTPMSVARENHTASLLASGKVLVVGGDNATGTVASAEIFDPAGASGAGSFSTTASMSTRRRNHSATTLPSGKVLVAGGAFELALGLGFIFPSTAEIFDPSANAGAGAFLGTGKMTSPHAYHPAVLLPSTRVLITAGIDGPNFSGSTETFDPAGNGGVGTFSLAGAILPRNGHAACLLPSGSALITGGYNGQSVFDSALVYGGTLGDSCGQDGYCQSGHCVDGVCCDQACKGTCETCLAAFKQSGGDGRCGPTKAGADPREQCAPGIDPCSADGQCNGAGACRAAAPAGTLCGPGICNGSSTSGQVCDGSGSCTLGGVVAQCAPFLCVGGACRTTCASTDDCVPGAWCKSGACTMKGANGAECLEPTACTSGFCIDNVCREAPCTDCGPPVNATLGGGGGCNFTGTNRGSPLGWLAAIGALKCLLRWRRRTES